MEQRSAFEIILQLRMLDSGIVPTTIMFGCPRKEVKAHMATMSPEDRRRAARKFRKMWKKAVRQALARAHQCHGLTKLQKRRREAQVLRFEEKMQRLMIVTPSGRPTSRQQRDRSHMVLEMLMRNTRNELAPAVAKMR